ncbi:MAG: PLP-dependent aminotransferase family protein [Thermoanaerobaculia bacterium]
MQTFPVRLDTHKPLYQQLYAALRERIVTGDLGPGDRLPPTRDMARDLGVSRNVVVAAYDQLLSEGYVQARVGSGTWVSPQLPDTRLTTVTPTVQNGGSGRSVQPQLSELARRAVAANPVGRDRQVLQARAGAIPFALETTLRDESAVATWNSLARRRRNHTPDGFGPPEGSLELRRALASYLHRSRGIQADADQILILTGVQQAIDLIGRAVLQPGSGVLMEDPGYHGARLAFEAFGAHLIPCPVDREGMAVAGADTRELPAQLAFVTPSHQFPTGVVMSLARRQELLAWASAADALVVEDDYEGEFRFDDRPLPAIHALDGEGRTVYIGSFSRLLYPDVRLGYAVLPSSLVEPAIALKRLSDWYTPTTTQSVLAELLDDGHYERHLRRLQQQMTRRRDVLLDSLEKHFGGAVEVTGAESGLHVMVWFPEPGPEEEAALLAHARDMGVGVNPLSPLCLSRPERLAVVLGYSGLEEAEIREGARRLRKAWQATRRAAFPSSAVPVA